MLSVSSTHSLSSTGLRGRRKGWVLPVRAGVGTGYPTTLNFLPDTHIVLVDAKEIAGDYERVWARLRETFGTDALPRAITMITGRSRSADMAQILILGAHGPRRLHVLVVNSS
jgi:L-lactate dehydrogenase complex protein LldG